MVYLIWTMQTNHTLKGMRGRPKLTLTYELVMASFVLELLHNIVFPIFHNINVRGILKVNKEVILPECEN